MPDTRVYDAAAQVLGVVIDGFADAGVDLPARQLVHAGEVAFDCEQVVVEVTRLFHGFPAAESVFTKCEMPRAAIMRPLIVRCVPSIQDDGTAPPVAELDATAKQVLTDAWHLADIVYRAYQDKSLFTGESGCMLAGIAAVEIAEPAGLFQASILELQVQI